VGLFGRAALLCDRSITTAPNAVKALFAVPATLGEGSWERQASRTAPEAQNLSLILSAERGYLVARARRRRRNQHFRGSGQSAYACNKGEHTMPADRLGHYMRSPEFLKRANEAVAEAVRDLESHGIQPVYLDRKAGRIVGVSYDALSEDAACEGRRVLDILKSERKRNGGEE
jgi:hypothetical protein